MGNDDIRIGLADVIANVMGAVEVIEGRDRKHSSGANCVQPGEVNEVVALVLDISDSLILLVWRVWNLIVIAAQGCNQTELIGRRFVEDDGTESTKPGSLVVEDFGAGSFQAQVGAVAGEAAVIRETLPVVAEAN